MKTTTPRLHLLSIYGSLALFFGVLFPAGDVQAQNQTYRVTAFVQTATNTPRSQVADRGPITVTDSFQRMGLRQRLSSTTSLGSSVIDASSKWVDSNPNDVNQGECQSEWMDRVAVNSPGRNGTTGTLTVRITTGGQLRPVLQPANTPIVADQGAAIAQLTVDQFLGAGTRLERSHTVNARGETIGTSAPFLGQEFLVQFPITFGTGHFYKINLRIYVDAFGNSGESFEVEADATAAWGGIASVTDSNGAPVSDYTVTSDSGGDYTQSLEPKKNLWAAGGDLLANEENDASGEGEPVNATVPEWSYGFRSTPGGSALTLFTAAQHQNGVGHPEVDGWIPGAGVLVNAGSVPVSVDLGGGSSIPVQPGQLLMQPTGSEFAVARWTAPEAGTYAIAARWVDVQSASGNGAAGYVVVNGEQIFGGQDSASGLFTGARWANGGKVAMPPRSMILPVGATVDFVVGANGDANADLTALNAAVRRLPTVTISAPASVVAGQDVNVTINSSEPLTAAALRRDGMNAGTDRTAPFDFVLRDLTPGVYQLQAEGLAGGVLTSSNLLTLTVTDPPTVARRGTAAPDAITATGSTFDAVTSGTWDRADIWRRRSDGGSGVPGPNDVAIIPDNVQIVLDTNRTVGKVFSEGRIAGESGNTNLELTVTKQLGIAGLIRDLTIKIPVGSVLTNVKGSAFFENIKVENDGEMVISKSLFATGGSLVNRGALNVRTGPGQGGPVILKGSDLMLAGTVRLSPGVAIAGRLVGLDGGTLIGLDGSTLIGNDGSTLVGNDGASLIGLDGSTLIGLDGGTLVGLDGGTLVGLDGGTLVGNDGASLVGNDGASLAQVNAAALIGNDGSTRPTNGVPGEKDVPLGSDGLSFSNYAISGNCNLIGNVSLDGGYMLPGSSPGTIVVAGNLNLGASSTTVLEVGGDSSQPTASDRLSVLGTANLGGNLIVRTVNGFTPAPNDSIPLLTYGAASGNFSSITSNAQIAFGPNGATVQVNGANPPAPKALNISTRMRVEAGDNVLIAGFIVTGSQPKRVIIRGLGPSLPVAGALADPILELDGGAVINDDWRSTQEAEIIATTIPPSNNQEAAIVATLAPGGHTAILRGKNNGTGVGLVEVYDLEPNAPAQLANISTRGLVQTGDNVMIGGFIVGGTYPAKVIVRAIGPSLAQQGVSGALQDPTLELVDSQGNIISNDNWRATQEAEVIATTVAPTNDNEAAIVATLVPGNYTAIVRGKDGTTGIALVEGFTL